MKVKAAVVRAHGAPLVIESLDLDEPRADEILVRLVASGVTRADIDARSAVLPMPLPFVPGAAGAGIVERVGDAVTVVRTGDAVLLKAAVGGPREPSVAGQPSGRQDGGALNLSGRRLDGSTPFLSESGAVNGFFFGQSSFATHLVCSASCATKLPMGAALEVLAAVPGDMLVGAGAVASALALQEGDTIVITGADLAGLAATMMAKARGAGMIVVADPRASRRDLATALGATATAHTDADLAAVVKSLAGDGARLALETTGHAAAHQACLDSLAPGGTCAVVGVVPETMRDTEDDLAGAPRVIPADMNVDHDMLLADMAALHASGRLPLETLIDFFPFELVNDALDALAAERVVKPVLRFSIGSFGDLDRALSEGAARETPDEPSNGGSVPDDAPAQDEPGEERQPTVPA